MALTTFTPPKAPDYSTGKDVSARIIQAQFGDGYSQRAADGLNPVMDKPRLTWSGLTTADADTIEAFFEARGGHEAFLYTLPREVTAKLWICKTWTRNYPEPNFDTINASFEQVFDLDSPDDTVVIDGGSFTEEFSTATAGTIDGGNFADTLTPHNLDIDGGSF